MVDSVHRKSVNASPDTFPCSILAVDDSEVNLKLIEQMLTGAGLLQVHSCHDSRKVLDLCQQKQIDIVLLDLRMPHIKGEELLPEIKRLFPNIQVIVVTALTDIPTVITCIKAGAFDYVSKPIESQLLLSAINRAQRILRLEKENQILRKQAVQVKNPALFQSIITQSQKMMDIFCSIETIAPSPWPILVSGETGVGKEMIVQAIHQVSMRKGPFVSVNAAGLDDHLFSDTLFGHVKGAFTGAEKDKPGLIHKAAAGTIFLDEIGDLSVASQVKLLRLIQEGEYMPLGSERMHHSDARIVTATNQDLWQLQRAGRFREDLNYRLRTHHIHIPPLREKLEDLPLLVDHFATQAANIQKKNKPQIPDKLIQRLQTYYFPGNIRELRSLIYDAISRNLSPILSPRMIAENYQANGNPNGRIPQNPQDDSLYFPQNFPTLQQVSVMLIQEALKRTHQNQSQAAILLGISQPALSRRLKNMKI